MSADDYTREFLQSDLDRITELEQRLEALEAATSNEVLANFKDIMRAGGWVKKLEERVESLENALRLLIDHPGFLEDDRGNVRLYRQVLPSGLATSMREELVRE